jgi:hypothetical protein
MPVRRFAIFSPLALALALLVPAPEARAAGGWQEWHQTGNDLFVTLDRTGLAHVEHHVRYRVVAGKMQSFDLPTIDMEAQIASEVSIVTEDGTRLSAHAEGISAKAVRDMPEADAGSQVVRVTVDDPKGLKRGTYAFVVAYDLDAWKTKHLTKDGSLVRVTFKQPPSLEGRDAARAVFRLPPGPTAPRILVKDDGSAEGEGDGTALVTLRRSAEVDELELVRAHVSRGEVVPWAVRVDAKSFAAKASGAPGGAPVHAEVAPKDRKRSAAAVCVALVLALMLGALFGRKSRAFGLEVARLGLAPRPLLPLPTWARPPIFALAFTAGVSLAVLSSPLVGAAFLLVAMLVLVELRPRKKGFRVRGPGDWKPLPKPSAESARDRLSPWIDGTTPRGAAAFSGVVAASYGLGVLAEHWTPGTSVFAPLAAVVLLPLFFSGVSGQLPSAALGRTLRLLKPLSDRVAKHPELRVKLYGRMPKGESRWDEARLRAMPRGAMPGVRGFEVGVVEARTMTGFLPTPEVLVRVFDGSAAHTRLEGSRDESLATRSALPGREADEKVLRFVPAGADPKEVETLLLTLAAALQDRRGASPRTKKAAAWGGSERRAPGKNARDLGAPLPV